MKVLLAGAFGNLGSEILKSLVKNKHLVVAADICEKDVEGLDKNSYKFVKIDATKPESLEGICNGADIVISTMGLTTASNKVTSYDIDYHGNLNLYKEAAKAKVKRFNYISVIACDSRDAVDVPMLHAKMMMEEEIYMGDLKYVIYRPTGYFYDIAKVFKPYVDKGEMQLLKGYHHIKANVVDCSDFADFIVEHMNDINQLYEVGGKETYTYEEMAKMCFKAANKPTIIKDSPAWMFNILANLPKIKKAGKHDIILFSKFTLSHDLVGKDVTGDKSFAKYLKEYFGGNK